MWRLVVSQLCLLCVLAQDLPLPVCLDSFDVHQDKIIRTQDSRAMGAKYINERDVSSRAECLRLCCETQDCDVFVFEEKSPGSCYLFQCGTPEDFKCKFTKHHNYTSAVLVINRHLTELESQIKHTQHEHELAKLRNPEVEVASPTVTGEHTTVVPGSKEVAQVIPTASQITQSRRCSRYQFECHGSGECIAIYNACDGIPQCADGSDEAPELACPSQASTVVPASKSNVILVNGQQQIQQEGSGGGHQPYQQVPAAVDDSPAMPVLSKQFKTNHWTPQMFETQHMGESVNNYMQSNSQQMNQQMEVQQPVQQLSPASQQQQQQQQIAEYQQSPPQLISQVKQYGREGEGMMYHPPAAANELLQWPQQPYQQAPYQHTANTGGSQIFSHKGSGLVAQSDRYRHAHNNKVVGEGGFTGQFDGMQPDYGRYNNYYENSGYHKAQVPGNWPTMHKPHEMAGAMEENMNIPVRSMPQGVSGQDYYYEENFRTRLQPQLIPQRLHPQSQGVPTPPETDKQVKQTSHTGEAEVENQELLAENENKPSSSNSSVKKNSAHHTSSNSTEKPKETHHHSHHNAHRKVDSLSAEMSENTLDLDTEGTNMNPRGAILSLTMGLCVTGIMLVLVGCRMRMVRRRMRRGSKSPYAHDADFLVNGMYL